MRKIKTVIKKCIHPFFILCMILIIIAGIIILYNSRQDYASETWVYECLKAYGDNLTELDINILSKELSAELEKKVGKIDLNTELSQEQLMELMAMVNDKLQYADYCIPKEDIAKISADIVKKLIAESTSTEYATLHKTNETIDKLEKQLSKLEAMIDKLEDNSEFIYSEQQIREIAKNASLDEATVRKWIQEMYPDINLSDCESAIKELAELLDVDAETLERLVEQAKDAEDSMDYITKFLGITEEKLSAALVQLAQNNNTDSRKLSDLLSKLNIIEADLQNQITNNMTLTTDSITSVQNQVTNNKNTMDAVIASNKAETDKQISENKAETDKQISENKAETDKQISENKAETDKKISENKAYTDTVIDELQNNVLFYEYDKVTNTLNLFKKPEGGSKR